jgi:hypothetical protein
MSLVVCANDSEKSLNRTSNFNSAFSWINSLKQTMRLPPNSEVAVQSVKVNKSSDITIQKSSIWFQYWGKDHLTLDTSSNNSLQEPILCRPKLDGADESNLVSVNELAVKVAKGMNEGMPHPDAYGLQLCSAIHDGTQDPPFQGYKMTSVYQGDQSGTNIIADATFNNHTTGLVGTGWTSPFDYDASVLTYTAESGGTAPIITGGAPTTREWSVSCLTNKRAPISRNRGIMIVDLLGLSTTPTDRNTARYDTRWQVGFVRALNNSLVAFGMPNYYHAENTTGFTDGSNLGEASRYPSFDGNFYDIVVSCDPATVAGNNRLKIHMSVPDDEGGICMEEVLYWGAWNSVAGATGANRYNMSTNSSRITKLKFEFFNEQVVISVGSGADGNTFTVISGYDAHFGNSGATNENCPKALNQSQWNLYPKVCVLGGSGKSLSIEHYSGVIPSNTQYTFDYAEPKNDWCCRMYNSNSDLARQVDMRPENRLSATNTYVPVGVDVSGDFDFKTNEIQFIIAPAPRNYAGTEQANMQSLLGFRNRAVLNPSNGGTQLLNLREYEYESDQRPVFSASAKSLFVRLDNFTQSSLNAGVGRPSKILYHMPRFDTSNRDLGAGLYYEPQERAYVPLNNSDDLLVNQLNLSICDESEQLATDLIGRTIVVLHFRVGK